MTQPNDNGKTVSQANPRDPTINVRELVESSISRLDDLSAAESRRVDGIMTLRAEYEEKLREAEAKRIDAIRAVDVNAVAVASERATQQATVLANQVSISAETLRALVAATANTIAQQLSALTAQLTDRISSLEKSQYTISGTGAGRKDFYGWVVGGVTIGITIIYFLLKISAN